MPSDIANFLSGMITMGFLVGAAFFLRFWTRTRDYLFLAFALAFFLLAMNQMLIFLLAAMEERSSFYLLRLAAFSLIVVAILQKNAGKR